MNEPCEIEWCDRPVAEGRICMRCAERFEVALGDVAALWDELDVVLTRQARYSDAEGRAGAETALPFNARASEVASTVRNILVSWCRLISEERGKPLPEVDTPAAIAGWLLHHVMWLRHHRAGAEAVEEILSAVSELRRVVDRPAERIYAGPCADCGGDMYGKPGAASVECRPCGLSYDVDGMLTWMRSQVYGRLVTAKEGAVLLSRFGLTTTRNRIDLWHFKKLIVVVSHDKDGKQLFLFDDLIERATKPDDTRVRRTA